MQNKLNIGSIKLPKESATKGFGFIGKRGSGKSYGSAVFAEELYKVKVPFVVFDPIDVWWGLKVAADGKGKGLPVVVFGKEHADIQLDRTMGKKIAEAVVKNNISCVISTFGMNKTEMREVVTDFSERLLQINNTPRQVIIEEAHEFVPQRVQGAMARCFSAVEALLVMGRNRGIGVTLINQRMATLNKDLLTQIDVLVAFRSVGPQDRKAFRDWVEVHNEENDDHFNEFMRSVPALKTGSAWVWSPEFLEKFELVKFRKRETFHPDRELLGHTFKMPEIKQGDVQSFIDSFTNKPELKIPAKHLKGTTVVTVSDIRQSSYSEIELQMKPAVKKLMGEEYRRGYGEGEMVGIEKGRAEAFAIAKRNIKKLLNVIEKVNEAAGSIGLDDDWVGESVLNVAREAVVRSSPPAVRPAASPSAEYKKFEQSVNKSFGTDISNPQQRILNALAWLESASVMQSTRSQLAAMSEQSPKSSGYLKNLGTLSTAGLIAYPSPGFVALTDAGRDVAEAPEEALTGKTIQERAKFLVSTPQRAMLEALIGVYSDAMTRDELAPASGQSPTSSGYLKNLGTLRTFGFIEYPQPGLVKAADLLFI